MENLTLGVVAVAGHVEGVDDGDAVLVVEQGGGAGAVGRGERAGTVQLVHRVDHFLRASQVDDGCAQRLGVELVEHLRQRRVRVVASLQEVDDRGHGVAPRGQAHHLELLVHDALHLGRWIFELAWGA